MAGMWPNSISSLTRRAKPKSGRWWPLAWRSVLASSPFHSIRDRPSGAFRGFTMRAVAEHQPIHFLTAPKTRKVHFPTADYRFLVRVAANTARAIAEVHAMGCTVGDINHSGILVSSKATVSLIDADSFQLDANGRLYPCLVGVPDYTPPELQGSSLAGVRRTIEHDHFGLAVTIFQLLFMGRHPYAGETSDATLSLEALIARNQFAFSRQRVTGSRPPKGVLTLDAFSDDMAAAFERAFRLSSADRPTAANWIGHLEKLERELSRCSTTPCTFFPLQRDPVPGATLKGRQARRCFWPLHRQTFSRLSARQSTLTNRWKRSRRWPSSTLQRCCLQCQSPPHHQATNPAPPKVLVDGAGRLDGEASRPRSPCSSLSRQDSCSGW